jgi:hypothetical protein
VAITLHIRVRDRKVRVTWGDVPTCERHLEEANDLLEALCGCRPLDLGDIPDDLNGEVIEFLRSAKEVA